MFQHETRDIFLCAHVDDSLCTGLREDVMWLKKQLLKEYELETKLMGEDDDMEKEAVYLGRTLEWSENGLGVRPDRRHVRSLLRELGMENCRSISTPLEATAEKEGDRSECPEMSAELATKHRAAVARVVYLAQDRLDLCSRCVLDVLLLCCCVVVVVVVVVVSASSSASASAYVYVYVYVHVYVYVYVYVYVHVYVHVYVYVYVRHHAHHHHHHQRGAITQSKFYVAGLGQKFHSNSE